MAQRRLRKLPLNHKHKTGHPGFDSFVPAQHEPELVFFVYDLL